MFDSNANNVYGGYAFNPQGGQQFQTKRGSTLTPEEYSRLIKQDNPFSLALTETDVLRGICNHMKQDGSGDTLVQDSDGSIRCEVCGYKFTPVDPSMTEDDVQEACNLVTDILQTTKLLYIDMPTQASREFYQIIPLINKVPQLFKLAVKNFNKHENYNAWGYRGQNMGTMHLFNMLSGALNGTAPFPGAYQQQMPNQGYAYNPNPGYMNPGMGAPVGAVPPVSNGFGYPNGAPVMGYAPQTQGFQYNPNPQGYQVAQPPVQQGAQAPAETTAVTDGQTVQAQANFKA